MMKAAARNLLATIGTVCLTLPSMACASDNEEWNVDTMHASLIAGGEWQFAAKQKGPDGKSECEESWIFRADGSSTVISGKQRVEQTWRVANDDGVDLLFTRGLSTSEGPDCLGTATDPASYPKPERAIAMLFSNGGRSALTCAIPGKVKTEHNGHIVRFWRDEDCFGAISPKAPHPAN